MTTKSQCARILAHLKRYGKITQIHASRMCIMRLAARVFTLRQQGVEILTVMVKASKSGKAMIAEYVLIGGAK